MFNAAQAQKRINEGKGEFIHDELGYGLRRKIRTGPLANTFHIDRLTFRTGQALKARGFQATPYHSNK